MFRKIFLITAVSSFILNFLVVGDIPAQTGDVTTLDGTVEEVDWENSSLTIKYMVDDINIVYEQTRFNNVNKDTKITKGDETIELDDLQTGDNVTVRYSGERTLSPKLLTVVVEE